MMQLRKSNLKLLQQQIGRTKKEHYGDIRIERLLLDVSEILEQQGDEDGSAMLGDPKSNYHKEDVKMDKDVDASMGYNSVLCMNDPTDSIRQLDQTALDNVQVHLHADGVENILDPDDSSCLMPLINHCNGPIEKNQFQSQCSTVSDTGDILHELSFDKNRLPRIDSSGSTTSSSKKPPRSKIPRPTPQISFKVPKISSKNKIIKSQFDLKFPKF